MSNTKARLTPRELTQMTLEILEGVKSLDLVEIDLKGESALADFILLASGTSTAHARGIYDRVYYGLKQHGILPLGVEGESEGEWILMDYDSMILHIFTEEAREAYRFEELHQRAQQRRIE